MDPVMLIKIFLSSISMGLKVWPDDKRNRSECGISLVSWSGYVGSGSSLFYFWKNYIRRFKDTNLFEQIFSHILEQCMKFYLVDTSAVFVDSIHVKARANSKKMRKRLVSQEALCV